MVDKELDELIREPDADPKRTKNLLEMQYRLNAQERELSMRPAPGTTKPTAAKSTKTRTIAASPVILDEPGPAPVQRPNDPNEPNG
jgi:hypothetical protein